MSKDNTKNQNGEEVMSKLTKGTILIQHNGKDYKVVVDMLVCEETGTETITKEEMAKAEYIAADLAKIEYARHKFFTNPEILHSETVW